MCEYVYKFYPPKDYAFKSLKNEELCFNALMNFDDKDEGKLIFQCINEKLENYSEISFQSVADDFALACHEAIEFHFRVLSLTNEYRSKSMWNEYAYNGSGFCVAYDKKDVEKISNICFPIEYTDINKQYDFFEKTTSDEMRQMSIQSLQRKKEKYINESEMRFICYISQDQCEPIDIIEYCNMDDKNEMAYCKPLSAKIYKSPKLIFKQCKPVHIYLGYNMNVENMEKITEIINEHKYTYSHIKEEQLI